MFVYNEPNRFGGFLGVFSNGVVTDSSWKCNESSIKPDDEWEQINFTDNTWPNAFVRQDNSGRLSSTRVTGIPEDVHWISAENHWATRFICTRRISTDERLANTCSSKYSVSLFPASAIAINLSERSLNQLHKMVRSVILLILSRFVILDFCSILGLLSETSTLTDKIRCCFFFI